MSQPTLSVENYTRKVYITTDPIEKIMQKEYFNPFKRRITVNDIITVRNPKKYEVIVTQLEPYVMVEFDTDYEQRISALELAVAGHNNSGA